jgi:hypothetical protein
VSEIYGSGGYDRGDSGGRADDYRHGGDAYDLWGDQDPDAANYADLYDAPASRNDRVADDDDGLGPGDQELDRGMKRAEYADYVRYRESGTYPADDYDTDPDLENYARGNDPRTAWRNQGRSDGPNGWDSYRREDHADRDGTSEPGDMWGDTYPDDAADYADTGTAATGTLTAELDHAPAETPDRPPAGDRRPGSPENDASSTDKATETSDALRQRVTELETANTELNTANAELKTENTQLGNGMAELESENAKLSKRIVELDSRNAALESRMDRLERSVQDKPTGEVADRRQPSGEREEGRNDQESSRRGPSDEALVFGATAAGGILTTVADFASRLPATDAGIAASFLAAGAAGVAWMHKRREAKNAHRSKG